MDDALFAPPDHEWLRISPDFATVLRVRMLVTTVIVFGAAATALWIFTDWRWASAAIALGLVWAAWRWFRLARWVRAWGYAERDDDLYLVHGLWFRELTVIPYGRMQAVKVESGPLTRALGLASVELVTASLQSGAKIPGLPKTDAEQLRDRLTAIGIGDEDGL
ncbi:MAG: PH domain-containing protein [Micropruina sp.]|uniref:PH domain-containing protein n=1 Tax=Micropruina sp. TaxID=2737536 RepID=UPI0039E46EBC